MLKLLLRVPNDLRRELIAILKSTRDGNEGTREAPQEAEEEIKETENAQNTCKNRTRKQNTKSIKETGSKANLN